MVGRRNNPPSQGLKFFGMVGAVMAGLKLKEHLDEYRRVPNEEDGLGPVALHSPIDEEGMATLDTEIPATRSTRKKTDCCMCCGMRCGLFWKAFGIVCLLLVGWNAIKLVIWMVTPSPTGLEGMPKYSTSLGCENAPYLYQDSKMSYSVPVGTNGADHTLDITGAAVGTVVVAQGDADSTEIKYDITLRTDDASLLEHVTLRYPTADDIEQGLSSSRMHLTTPKYGASKCMRYDMTVYLPPTAKKLDVQTRGASQLKFDTESNFDLDALSVSMISLDENNMLLPHKGVHAGSLTFEMTRGWLVGDVAIVDKTTLTTQRGDAVMNVHVHPAPSTAEPPATARLQTTTGAGRSDVFYVSHPGHPHRPISSVHRSSKKGDLYLTYKEAEFKGTVNLKAKSYSAKGLQGTVRPEGEGLPWVGDKDGSDSLEVNSPSGWVGLYF
ncbi:hypothetical protein POSPLADRAFT_1038669 [Postia placenta MAD-698-R-SB12]|uniref:Uncharacterized protein n=1 Tax=Postia placenta MAD-698-R-SB12 TaxID=670580 RepID=A0A1X6NDU3_9APHY|nr:hypothetical protein POSPLADRAFT_1038669 [Postia placenta MAD-698-R-SB12]OSX66596.1 hypothetical protein POSPLADRAFT_1038669 [Postia placenta MAD-698-R-SB12]